MNLDRLKYRYWQHTDWHDINSPLEAVYCNAVDGCDPTIAVSDFEFCTGLKDKNGKLIYEGDVIKDEFYRRFTIVWSEEDCMFEGRVIYRDPEYSDRFDLYKGATDDVEIIGNIHEQAEQKDVK